MDDSKKDISQIKKYLNGELDACAMHQLEREAQDDPFLMDAMDGFEKSASATAFDFGELDQRLADRIGESKVRKMFPWKIYAAAASLLLFFTIGYVMWPKPEVEQKQVADLVTPTALADHAATSIDTSVTPVVAKELIAKAPVPPLKKRRVAVFNAPQIVSDDKVAESVSNSDVSPAAAMAPEAIAKTNNPTLSRSSLTDSAKRMSELMAKLSPPLPAATTGNVGNANPPVRGFSNAKPDTATLNEIVIPGLPKLDASAIAKRSAAQLQTLDNKVKEAKVKTPEKGHDAMLSQAGIALDRDMPTPSKKDAAADRAGRLSAPPLGQAKGKGYLAGSADAKTDGASGDDDGKPGVSGLATKADNIKTAHPKMGWDSYNKYLKAKATGAEGTVRVSFTVDAKGQLGDFKTVKSVNEALDKKAIDLIKNGPAWLPEVSGKMKTVELKVAFSKE